MKKGEIIVLSSGEYTDYCVGGVFRSLCDLDIEQLTVEFNSEYRLHPDAADFAGWAVRRGLIKELRFFEVHVGGYEAADITVTG